MLLSISSSLLCLSFLHLYSSSLASIVFCLSMCCNELPHIFSVFFSRYCFLMLSSCDDILNFFFALKIWLFAGISLCFFNFANGLLVLGYKFPNGFSMFSSCISLLTLCFSDDILYLFLALLAWHCRLLSFSSCLFKITYGFLMLSSLDYFFLLSLYYDFLNSSFTYHVIPWAYTCTPIQNVTRTYF